MAARLIRCLPLVVILGVAALIVFLYVSYKSSPNRAKEVLISFFTRLCAGLSVLFVLACVYALLDKNTFALDIAASFLGVSLVALGIVKLCELRFRRNNPQYRRRASKSRVKRR